MLRNILDYWDWWAAELRAIVGSLPDRLKGHDKDYGDKALSERYVEGAQPFLVLRLDGNAVFTGSHIRFRCSNLRLPFTRLMEVAKVTVADKTPFPAGQVHILPGAGDGNEPSQIYVLKKEVLDLSLTKAMAMVGRIDGLAICDGNRVQTISRRALEDIHPVFSHIRYWRNFLLSVSAALLIGICVTYMQAHGKYADAEQVLLDQLEKKRADALQVRKLLDHQQKSIAAVDAARKGKAQAIPLLRVWEELTRLLPDDAWLTDVTFDGGEVTVTGFATQSAASLIATLDATPLFFEPNFISPVVRVPGQSGERFEMRMRLQ